MESKLNLKALNANKNIRMRNYWINRLKGFEFNNYFQDSVITEMNDERAVITVPVPAVISEKLNLIANSLSAKRLILLAALGVLAQKCSSANDACIFIPVNNIGDGTDCNDMIPVWMNDFSRLTFPQFVTALNPLLNEDCKNSNYSLPAILSHNNLNLQGISKVGLQIDGGHRFSADTELNMELLFSFNFKSGTELEVTYHKGRFSDGYIQRISNLYINLLQGLLNNKEDIIRQMEIISPAERKVIVEDFNNTIVPIPGNTTILDLFQQQVNIQPDRVAVQFKEKQLTYLELDLKSNQVANYLRDNFDCDQKVIGVLL